MTIERTHKIPYMALIKVKDTEQHEKEDRQRLERLRPSGPTHRVLS
jgi:hypothetical protein